MKLRIAKKIASQVGSCNYRIGTLNKAENRCWKGFHMTEYLCELRDDALKQHRNGETLPFPWEDE